MEPFYNFESTTVYSLKPIEKDAIITNDYTVQKLLTKFNLIREELMSLKEVKDVILGGSLAIELHGRKLYRPLHDLDISIVYKLENIHSLAEVLVNRYSRAESSSGFNNTLSLLINNIKCDIWFKESTSTCNIVETGGSRYFLEPLSSLIEWKIEASTKNSKHIEDLKNLILNKPTNFSFSYEHTL